jgi:DNA-binding transcriptional LysR family regulator
VAFVHLPIDDQGLELVPVRSVSKVAVLPVGHPLAGEPEISIADVADDPVITHRGASPGWEAFHNVDPRPDGRQPRRGPAVDNLEEKLQHVAAGRAISIVPVSLARIVAQDGVAHVPVSDVPPMNICLAWKSGWTLIADRPATAASAGSRNVEEVENIVVLEQLEQSGQLVRRRPCRGGWECSVVSLHVKLCARRVRQGDRDDLLGHAASGLSV